MHSPRFRAAFLALLLPLCLLLGANQCGKEDFDVLPLPETGTLQVAFRHHFGPDSLIFGNQPYIVPSGDTLTFRYFTYLVSNVKLLNSQTGAVYSEPGSYHFISTYHNRYAFTVAGIPAGNFDQIEFSIGVEEPANMAGDRTSDLGSNMVPWNSYTGYDFFVFEGGIFRAGRTPAYGLLFKVQGASNYKTLTFNLPQTLQYQQTENYNLTMGADFENLFRSPHLLAFNSSAIVEGKTNPKKLADNYASSVFRVTKISRLP